MDGKLYRYYYGGQQQELVKREWFKDIYKIELLDYGEGIEFTFKKGINDKDLTLIDVRDSFNKVIRDNTVDYLYR